jgi:hypothetical protein
VLNEFPGSDGMRLTRPAAKQTGQRAESPVLLV